MNFPNNKPPKNELFISMLSEMVMNCENCQPHEESSADISTSDLVRQILICLKDEFVAEINLEENHVICLGFSNNSKFKLRLSKE